MSEEEVQEPVEEDILTPEYISIDDWKSNEIDKLAGSLAKAQGEMGSVKKGSVNPFYKSNYADINNCLEDFYYSNNFGGPAFYNWVKKQIKIDWKSGWEMRWSETAQREVRVRDLIIPEVEQ